MGTALRRVVSEMYRQVIYLVALEWRAGRAELAVVLCDGGNGGGRGELRPDLMLLDRGGLKPQTLW